MLAPGREEDDGLMLPQMLRQLRRRSGMLQMVQIGDEVVATCSLACTGGSPSSTTDAIIFLTPRGEYTVSHTVSFTGEDESMVMLRGIHGRLVGWRQVVQVIVRCACTRFQPAKGTVWDIMSSSLDRTCHRTTGHRGPPARAAWMQGE